MLARLKKLRRAQDAFVDAHEGDKDIQRILLPEWKAIDDLIAVLKVQLVESAA
ncbi:hypothetical protein PQX77_007183 [Marasmius sp. AFHP31]|nr:hypothetical protein PQX77_007183 [Marasmius sp. AFHP31]